MLICDVWTWLEWEAQRRCTQTHTYQPKQNSANPDDCLAFTLQLSPAYDAACNAACDAWAAAGRRARSGPETPPTTSSSSTTTTSRCSTTLPTFPSTAQNWAASRPACMDACLAAKDREEAWTFDYADCLEREARKGRCRLLTRCWNPLLGFAGAVGGTLCARVTPGNGNGTDGGDGTGSGASTAAAASGVHIQVNWQTLLTFFVFAALAIVGLVLLVIRIGGRLIAGEGEEDQQQQQLRRSSSDEMQQSVSHHLYVPLAGDE